MPRVLSIVRRVAVWTVFSIAVLLTLWAVFCMEERVRGKKKWEAYRAAAIARGAKLDLKDVIPPDVPDAENFAAIPMIQELFRSPDTIPTWFPALKIDQGAAPGFGDMDKDQSTDLAAWQAYFVKLHVIPEASGDAAADVLKALAAAEPELAQLREGLKRPRSKYPVQWNKGIETRLPHLSPMMLTAKVLRLQMAARLATGDSAGAFESCREILELRNTMRGELVLISGLVRIAMLTMAEAGVWNGIHAGAWHEAELRKLQAEFENIDLKSDWRFSLESERALMNTTMDGLHAKSSGELARLVEITANPGSPVEAPSGARLAVMLYPRGWLYLSQTLLNQYDDASLAAADDLAAGRAPVHRPGDIDDLIRLKGSGILHSLPYVLALLTAPAVEGVHGKYLAAMARTEQLESACALELYRMKQGAFPEKLEAVVPEFAREVPKDPIDLQPMRYRRAETGYELWSIATDRKDDEGKREDKGAKEKGGDWVWRR